MYNEKVNELMEEVKTIFNGINSKKGLDFLKICSIMVWNFSKCQKVF